jgi:mitochondrial fission protein ELM1
MSVSAPQCWILSDGTAGMEAQAEGLAKAMGLETIVKTIIPGKLLRMLPWLARLPGMPAATAGDTLGPPYPAIAITCGRRHAGASIALKRLSGGRVHTIHIQDPRISPGLFDTLVVPEHDPTRGPNVITTTGSLNRINDALLSQKAVAFATQVQHLPTPRIAVNLGGDTQQYTVDSPMAERIAASLSTLADSHGCGLMITTSRRTGAGLVAALAPLATRSDTVLWQGNGPNPYLGFLGLADAIIVTADSINMVCEACSTGKPVHLLPLGAEPRRRAAFLQNILASGRARAFNGNLEIWDYTPLRETERVADLLLTQLRSSGILA